MIKRKKKEGSDNDQSRNITRKDTDTMEEGKSDAVENDDYNNDAKDSESKEKIVEKDTDTKEEGKSDANENDDYTDDMTEIEEEKKPAKDTDTKQEGKYDANENDNYNDDITEIEEEIVDEDDSVTEAAFNRGCPVTNVEEYKVESAPGRDSNGGGGHNLGGLTCEKYGGPSDEFAAEMVYWSDIPSDSSYVSPFKNTPGEERVQYMTFEPDLGG